MDMGADSTDHCGEDGGMTTRAILPFDEETDMYTLPSGRTFYANCGVLGVPMNNRTYGDYWQVTYGWDGAVDMDEWQVEDAIALCEHIIAKTQECIDDLKKHSNYCYWKKRTDKNL